VNLRQIEVFHAVYLCGSITSAARNLRVSQPSVSKTLRHIEDGLRFPLFHRLKGRLIPTEEAHSLFHDADDVYTRVASLKLTAKNLGKTSDSHLRIAVLPSLGLDVTAEAIGQFRTRNAGVTFEVQARDHCDMPRCLYERESDITIGFLSPTHPRLSSTIVGAGEMVLLHRTGEITRTDARVDLRRLCGVDYIGLKGSGALGTSLASELERRGIELKEVASVRAFFVAAALVRHSVGITVVDEFTARAMITPELAFHRLTPPIAFTVHCSWLEERPPSRTCRQFIDVFSTLLAPSPLQNCENGRRETSARK
jgi:DNA-binding transcriptional LysR family regulator